MPPNTEILIINRGSMHQLSVTDFQEIPTAKDIRTLEITNGALQQISNSALSRLTSLRQLILRNNNIQVIERYAFSGLQDLEILDLSNNQIPSPSSSDLLQPLERVLKIDLSNNRINSFPNEFFAHHYRLQELNIEGNSIYNLRGTPFRGARSLRKLFAGHCSISTIENDFFPAVNSLEMLDLTSNEINSLPNTGAFAQLRGLRNLTLKGNSIYSLVEDQFSYLNLDVLDLSKNIISTVNPNTFRYVQGLRELDLSYNNIQSLPSYIFQPIAQSLYQLRLNNNIKLLHLPDEIFSGVEKLFELNVSSCSLKEFSEDHFRSLTSIKLVDVSNNALQSLPQSFIDRININAMSVNLDNNKWQCDCMIKPLRTWLQLSNPGSRLYCKHQTVNSFTCALPQCVTPASLAGKDIVLLSDQDLGKCETTGAVASQETGVILGAVFGAIGGVILIIVIVIVVMCLYRRRKRGDPLFCVGKQEDERQYRKSGREKAIAKRNSKREKYYEEKKERRNVDPEIGSITESDKSFMIRNYFHSMNSEPDAVSDITQSMTRKNSVESLSQSGYGYGSRRGSRQSSQYSLNAGYKIESAV